jgi:hypothetical protein
LLRRAAQLAYRDLANTEQAFKWLGDALVTHVSDDSLDALEQLAEEVGEPVRAETVLGRALEEVFDGPLVRKLLARRATLRRDRLDDRKGAATDLKRLHDLSPSDTSVMDQLSQLYTELEDWRGMVQLYEDQILRGKDPGSRAELARKVARLWEERLDDPREAADAWRRVLRMKSGDPEASEGLERAKSGMLGRPAKSIEPAAPEQEPENPTATSPLAGASPPVPQHYEEEDTTGSLQRADAEAQEPTQPQPQSQPQDDESGEPRAERPDLEFPKADDVTLSTQLEDFDEGYAAPPTSRPPPPPPSRPPPVIRSSAPPPPPPAPPAWGSPPPQSWAAVDGTGQANGSSESTNEIIVPVDEDELIVDEEELVDDEPQR